MNVKWFAAELHMGSWTCVTNLPGVEQMGKFKN